MPEQMNFDGDIDAAHSLGDGCGIMIGVIVFTPVALAFFALVIAIIRVFFP